MPNAIHTALGAIKDPRDQKYARDTSVAALMQSLVEKVALAEPKNALIEFGAAQGIARAILSLQNAEVAEDFEADPGVETEYLTN